MAVVGRDRRVEPGAVLALQGSIGNRAVAAMVGGRTSGAVLARLQTGAQFRAAAGGGTPLPDAGLERVAASLDSYNPSEPFLPWSDKQGYADAQLALLDRVEHELYAWLHAHRRQPDPVAAAAVRALLDDLQGAHRRLVDFIHRNDLKLWTTDRSTMSGFDAMVLDMTWDALRESGETAAPYRFQITSKAERAGRDEPHVFQGFSSEMRAMHARLLSRPRGRELLKALVIASARGSAVSIEPYHPQVVQNLGGLAGAEASAKDRPNALETAHGPGTGSASTVAVQSGLRDAQATNVDVEGHAIASPAFVLYAHELVHALHNIRGENRAALNADAYRGAGGRPVQQPGQPQASDWENEEEFVTIALGKLTENMIRDEHGLTHRWGHRR